MTYTKKEMIEVVAEMMAEECERLGELPTAEEFEMYFTGEMDAAAAGRVRRFLVAYPEIAKVCTEAFPIEEEGDAGMAEDTWDRFNDRIRH